ncbi:hypothetical protein Barb6_03282 [Bacteroidales bacterium Barb6]|nr:hypothetical protein Barb4_05237 [Bacteroidales bacterium Barb4]OAV64364.1 hypothetical protein Barb6_03282 [Bacteroidales bacterium Barb6]
MVSYKMTSYVRLNSVHTLWFMLVIKLGLKICIVWFRMPQLVICFVLPDFIKKISLSTGTT